MDFGDSLRGKTALVIGGSGGIGRALTVSLVAAGVSVFAQGRSADKLSSLGRECEGKAGKIHPIQKEYEGLEDFVGSLSQAGDPDILAVCWGPAHWQGMTEARVQDWGFLCETNLALPGALVSRFGPGMYERGYGRILLFGTGGHNDAVGYKKITLQAAAKAGLGVIARSAALVWGDGNVACNVICPAWVQTEYLDARMSEMARRKSVGNRPVTAEELALELVRLLKNPDNIVNGAIIPMGRGFQRDA